MVRAAVCDDEAAVRDVLSAKMRSFFAQKGWECRIALFEEGGALLEAQAFDLVFLDIRMEGLGGMETARRLRDRGDDCCLVFVTALDEYVYDAFEVQADDYLIKPLEESRFIRTMERICARLEGRRGRAIAVRRGGGYRRIRLDEIVFCEVLSRKIYLHTAAEVIDYYERMAVLEKQMDERFFKCHRSYLVNLDHVDGCAGGMAEMDNGEHVPVSRSRGRAFAEALLRRIQEG